MSQHDTLTLEQAVFTVLEGFTLPQGVRKVLEAAYYNRAALSTTQPAQAGWCPGCSPDNCQGCGPAAKTAQAAQGAGEVVAGIIAEWRDVILNARHNMDGVLDNDQINEVLNVWDDMAIEVDRTIGKAVPSNAQAQLRAVEKLIDGSQPIDIPGALAVIRHGGTTPSTQPAAGADVNDTARLDALARPGWELSMNNEPECGPDELWQVHRVSGGRNDREWTLIGKDTNPRAAIDAALSTNPQRQDGGD